MRGSPYAEAQIPPTVKTDRRGWEKLQVPKLQRSSETQTSIGPPQPHLDGWSTTLVLMRLSGRSADFQSAASPICDRQSVRNFVRQGIEDVMQNPILRYSRLKICATSRRAFSSRLHAK